MAVLSLLMVLLICISRLSNSYVCLQIGQNSGFNGPGIGLLDLERYVYIPDTRTNNSFFGLQSPDRTLTAAMQYNPNIRTQDLVVRSNAGLRTPTTLQSGFPGGGFYGRGFGRLQWSPDSSHLAYLFTDRDQNVNLSVINSHSNSKQTVSLGRNDTQGSGNQRNIALDGWSGDGLYLSINEQAQSGEIESVWSSTDLKEAKAVFKTGAWSPQGHLFAGLKTGADSNDEIVVWSSEKELQTGYVLAQGQTLQSLDWSPDGHYFTLQSHVNCELTENCSQRWSYDIFNSNGTLVVGNIAGKVWAGASSVATAVWATDSQNLVFLQDSKQNSLELDLVAWHAADNSFKTIAAGLDSSLSPDMFYVTPFRRPSGGSVLALTYNQPSGKRMLIPTDHDGKIRIELADLDGGHRTTLVDSADEIISPQQSNFAPAQFWSPDGQSLMIIWATGEGKNHQVHLTWARADGSGQHDINDNIQSIDRVGLMRPGTAASQKWISYLAMRNGVYSIELAELDTGKHYPLLTGLKANDTWTITLSPDARTVGLVLQSYTTTAFIN
jgi:hypothetical protein